MAQRDHIIILNFRYIRHFYLKIMDTVTSELWGDIKLFFRYYLVFFKSTCTSNRKSKLALSQRCRALFPAHFLFASHTHTHHLLSVIIYISTRWPSFRLSRQNFEIIVPMYFICVLHTNTWNYNFYKIN